MGPGLRQDSGGDAVLARDYFPLWVRQGCSKRDQKQGSEQRLEAMCVNDLPLGGPDPGTLLGRSVGEAVGFSHCSAHQYVDNAPFVCGAVKLGAAAP